MENQDSIHLLKECDAGSKMAVSSINEVLDKTQSSDLRELLLTSRAHHEKLGNEIHSLLQKADSEPKEPGTIAKSMAWMKTNLKLELKESDATIADLITDGCNMGIKSLHKYMNQYPAASQTSKNICRKLSDIEEELCRDLRSYL